MSGVTEEFKLATEAPKPGAKFEKIVDKITPLPTGGSPLLFLRQPPRL